MPKPIYSIMRRRGGDAADHIEAPSGTSACWERREHHFRLLSRWKLACAAAVMCGTSSSLFCSGFEIHLFASGTFIFLTHLSAPTWSVFRSRETGDKIILEFSRFTSRCGSFYSIILFFILSLFLFFVCCFGCPSLNTSDNRNGTGAPEKKKVGTPCT